MKRPRGPRTPEDDLGWLPIAQTVLRPPDTPPLPQPTVRPADRRLWTGLALVGILLLAAVLRVWRLHVLPPGLNNDEGVNALDVEHIIAGWRPVFLPANNGREALFMYCQAILGVLFGVSPTTLRLTAAIWGVVTVGLTFGLARRWYGRNVGLLAGGLLAVAFWHVVLSRVGLRAITAPAFYLGVMWALGEALQRRRLALYILAGFLLGLSEYTYISARVLPVILAAIWLALVWRDRRQGRSLRFLAGALAVTGFVALVTFLPEGLYFHRHPEMLIGRTDQVLVFNSHPAIIGTPITFRQSLSRTLNMFFVAGDTNWMHNIAGLPVLDPLLAVAFLAGVALTLRQFGRGLALLVRPALPGVTAEPRDLWPAVWLLAWCGALLAGSSVTQESPNYLRLSALMPAVAILCALGVDMAMRAMSRKRPPVSSLLPVILAAALLLGEGARTAYLYFVVWAPQSGVYTAFDTDTRDAAIASLSQADVPIADTFIQLDASSPFIFFRPPTANARWLREYSTVATLPPPGQPALWVYSHFQQTPPLPSYLPNATLVAKGLAQPGHPGYFLYRASPTLLDAYRAGFAPVPGDPRFGDQLQLIGMRLPPAAAVRPGATVTVTLLWKVLQDATVNFGLSIHLTDAHGVTWAQSDRQGMMRHGWLTGDTFASQHVITLPADLPPVPLQVDASASILDPIHQPAAVLQTLGAPITLSTLAIQPGLPGTATPPADAKTLVPGLSVVGAHISQTTVKPGDTLNVTIRWLRTANLPPTKVDVSLVDATGATVTAAAGDPAYGAVPIGAVPTGRVMADPRLLRLPAVLHSGPLQVVLTAVSQNGAMQGRLTLGTVQAQDRPHNFTVPASQYASAAVFGGQIALLGYDLSTGAARPGGALSITLNWQALQTPDRDYTVFVHLLDSQGKIAAQNDSQPEGGALPTRGWLPKEVVSDHHVIPLPPTLPAGAYHIELGWYDAATGKRLPLNGTPTTDHLALNQTIIVP